MNKNLTHLQSTFNINIYDENGQDVSEQQIAEPADGLPLLPLVAAAAADCDHNLRGGVAGHLAVVQLAGHLHLVPATDSRLIRFQTLTYT